MQLLGEQSNIPCYDFIFKPSTMKQIFNLRQYIFDEKDIETFFFG